MAGYDGDRIRRRVGWAMLGLSLAWLGWVLTPGLPVFLAPRASAAEKAAGLALFEREWQPHDTLAHGDGLGPVFNARSCVECHFQGGLGGGGDNRHNVLAFEAHPTVDRPDVKGGLVHKFAVENRFFEKTSALRDFFPIVPNGVRVESGCQVLTLDFDPVHTQSVNTTALFGAGWIDRISSKSITHHRMKRAVQRIGQELDSHFEGALPGRPRVLAGGRVGKFGWKAQFATLEEFVAAACANEIGLGNPRMNQAKPMVRSPYPEVEPDLDAGQFRALVAFVDTLARPVAIMPETSVLRDLTQHGEQVFNEVGCALCHTPSMGGVEGIYSDFLLHRLDDRSKGGRGYSSVEVPPVPLPHEYPLPEEWKTPPLWGVADSAPYFHDGGSPTLESAILRHFGDAESVTARFRGRSAGDREALIAFLRSLKAPADAQPVLRTSLASRR